MKTLLASVVAGLSVLFAFLPASAQETRITQTLNVDDYDRLKALNTERVRDDSVALVTDEIRGGTFHWRDADRSAELVFATVAVTSVDASTDQLTATSHGLRSGEGVLATGGDGLTANTTVYYVSVVDENTVRLYSTYANARANGASGLVDLTGPGTFSLKGLVDPLQGVFVIADGDNLDGSSGVWERRDTAALGYVTPEMFGCIPDGVYNCSHAFQAAMTFQYRHDFQGPRAGGVVRVNDVIISASGMVFEDNVSVIGQSTEASYIRKPTPDNSDMFHIPRRAGIVSIRNLTLDGNRDVNTAGNGISFEGTLGSGGNSNQPFLDKVGDEDDAYKHTILANLEIGNFDEAGISKAIGGGFKVIARNIASAHNGGHCIDWAGTDDNLYDIWAEKCGLSGLVLRQGAFRLIGGKIIWNNRLGGSWAGLHLPAPSSGQMQNFSIIGVETQDNYGDGFVAENIADCEISVLSNQNGYSAVGAETVSSRSHANFRFGNVNRCTIEGASFTYKDAVGTDGLWTTETPYEISGSFNPSKFSISSDGLTNDEVDGSFSQRASYFNGEVIAQQTGATDKAYRFFRSTPVGELRNIDIHESGTANIQHRLSDNSHTTLNAVGGDIIFGDTTNGGLYNDSKLRFGPLFVYRQTDGRLYVSASDPSSTDGLGSWIGDPGFLAETGTSFTPSLTTPRLLQMGNAAANTFTVPPDSTTNFPDGTTFRVCQGGAGTTTVEAASGVFLNNVDGGSLAVSARFSCITLYKRASSGEGYWSAYE
ncbi:MAG: hypothetical protein AAGB02_03190 [Pseudomonadota bacterium]